MSCSHSPPTANERAGISRILQRAHNPMTLLRIGGVPEHFNLPWHLALDEGAARAAGVDVQWQDFPDGSGAMAHALREQRLDAAMLLTEGAVAGIAAGGLRS